MARASTSWVHGSKRGMAATSAAMTDRLFAMSKAPRKSLPASIDATLDLLGSADYLADRSLATVLFLALKMGRPLFLEGEAGVGKTEIAKRSEEHTSELQSQA